MTTNRMGLEQESKFTNESMLQFRSAILRGERIASGEFTIAIIDELLAHRKASKEPVAWTDAEELRDANSGGCGYLFPIAGSANKFADSRRQIMLYAAPPIQAAKVPDELLSSMEEVIRISDREHEAWSRAKANIKRFRAVMLQSVTYEP